MGGPGGFHTADRFGDVDRTYYPGDFSGSIRRYAGVRGAECPPVDSGYAHPDHSVLEGPALEYYLWWRDRLDAGELLRADSGYVWLRACELINSDEEPGEAMRRIVEFTRTCSKSLRLAPMVAGLAEGYALSRGLPLDSFPRGRPFASSRVSFAWDVTRYPMRRPDPDILLSYARYDWTRVSGLSDADMAEVVFLSMSGIDEMVRTSGNQGLIKSIGCEPVAATVRPLDGFADFSGRRSVRMPVLRPDDEALCALVDAIVRTAARLSRDDGKAGPPVPRGFPLAHRKIVAAAVDAVVLGEPWDAKMFRASTDGWWGDDDLDAEDRDGPEPPVLLPQAYPETSVPNITLRELESNRGAESYDDMPYVPSGRTMTSYQEMDDSQRSYYVSWRTAARRGEYRDTDSGYLWLYCVELINRGDGPAEAQAELERAARAFRESNPHFLMTAAADHALLNGFDPPPEALGRRTPHFVAYMKLASRPTGRMSLALAEQYSGYDAERYTSRDPALYEAAFTLAVRAVDRAMEELKGRRIVSKGGTAELSTTRRLYQGLWTPRHPVVEFGFRNVLGSKRVSELMEGVYKTAIRAVNTRLGRPCPRPADIRPEYAEAAERAVAALMARRDSAERARKAAEEADGIAIDWGAVESAERDLEEVTRMMAAPGEEEPDEEIPEVRASQGLTGWDAFAASLDEAERAFLAASLTPRGAGARDLEDTGRRPSEVESSVNTKAMDAIGDAVMEGGIAFEEYAEEIRGALRWPRSRGGRSSR